MSQERTEAPTQRRFQELGSQGTTARSHDLTAALVLFAAVVSLQQVAPLALGQTITGLQTSLTRAGRPEFTAQDLPALLQPVGRSMLLLLVGVVVPAATVALAAGLFQIRGRFAFRAVTPSPGRLNPAVGFRRLFSIDALISLLWPLLKVAVVVLAVQATFQGIVQVLPTAVAGGLEPQIQLLGNATFDVARNGAGALVLLSVADVLYRRWQFLRQARMTRREVREEVRQNEGDPAIRNRIRALQRRMARSRMLHRVPSATAVVVNPTHFAVALAYDAEKMAAPEVVAKGVDLIAERIIEIAREHRVPIVPNPPLARTLYKSVEIGQPIPTTLYQAVAEILAYVFTLRRRR
ncbi:MAG TPA: EscU/YscU/HrcU family type III secretion system export apparatus switch protein [Chloroflexota bacterium]|nr:EscU/YscU/HrcU family type III secretion system export apparatus switch protein [Chloroflexota bacterium]